MQVVTFVNILPRVFTWSWDGSPYVFQPGERVKMETWKAQHFAGHLIDEMLVNGPGGVGNMVERERLLIQVLPESVEVVAQDVEQLKTKIENMQEPMSSEIKPSTPPAVPSKAENKLDLSGLTEEQKFKALTGVPYATLLKPQKMLLGRLVKKFGRPVPPTPTP